MVGPSREKRINYVCERIDDGDKYWQVVLIGCTDRAYGEGVLLVPALEREMVCCSIASWIDVRSCSFILSNSSIRHTP